MVCSAWVSRWGATCVLPPWSSRLSPCPQLPDQVPTFSAGVRNCPPQWASGPVGTGIAPCWPSAHTPPATTWSLDERPSPPWEFCQLTLLWGLRERGFPSSQTQIPFPCVVQEKKRRRAENLKRRLENERKAEVVQVVSVALLRGPEPWPSGALHPRCLCTPASQPLASHCDPRPLMGSLPLPREQSRDYSPSNAPSHTTPRSETLPSSSGQRRSSFAPLRSGIPWPCCRSSHPRVQQPRSELRTAQRPSVAKHRI